MCGFFARVFLEEFFGRNSLFTLLQSAKLFEYEMEKEAGRKNLNPCEIKLIALKNSLMANLGQFIWAARNPDFFLL